MFYVLSKILSFLTDPLTWIVACFILGVLLRKKPAKRVFFWTGIALFILMGNGALISLAERHWVRNVIRPLPEATHYEYALVQGGFADFNPATGKTQLFDEAERLIEPVRLYREGRVNKLMITGDGSIHDDRNPGSSKVFLEYLASLGVDTCDVILDTEARTTLESVNRTRELLGPAFDGRNCLLVTSAIHMPRTIRVYHKAGIDPVPFATSVPLPYKLEITNIHLASGNLDRWRKLIHEWVGMVAYGVAGSV